MYRYVDSSHFSVSRLAISSLHFPRMLFSENSKPLIVLSPMRLFRILFLISIVGFAIMFVAMQIQMQVNQVFYDRRH